MLLCRINYSKDRRVNAKHFVLSQFYYLEATQPTFLLFLEGDVSEKFAENSKTVKTGTFSWDEKVGKNFLEIFFLYLELLVEPAL